MKTHTAIQRLLAALPLILAALLCHPQPATAAVPEAINYQAVARKADGTPISNQQVRVRASILRSTINGVIAYQEVHLTTTTAGGQFSIKIGAGVLVQGSFTTLDWANFLHFLKVEVDPVGGTAFADLGTQQMLSVPYAHHAKTSDTTLAVSGTTGRFPYFDTANSLGDSNLYYSSGFLGLGDSTPSYYLDVVGTIRSQTNLRADADVIATDDVTAGGNVAATGNVTAGANVTATGTVSAGGAGSIFGALTVNNGKGVAYNASNGTNLKIFKFTTATFGAVLGGHGLSAEGAIGFASAGFTSPPTILVGDIDVTGGTTGELYRVQLVLYGATATGAKARLLNTSPNPVNYTITWNCIAIGN